MVATQIEYLSVSQCHRLAVESVLETSYCFGYRFKTLGGCVNWSMRRLFSKELSVGKNTELLLR